MEIPFYQVDAFADRLFTGNPAAVCPLKTWLPDATLQAIAAENNLAETAFFVREGDDYRLRWFTPMVEAQLCGHATLASAYVLFKELAETRSTIRFQTLSGILTVSRDGERLALDFPSYPPHMSVSTGFAAAFGHVAPSEIYVSKRLIGIYPDAATVRALEPDFARLCILDPHGVIVTAPGSGKDGDVDFVSRFFAPSLGINEDSVTGSIHSELIPFWAARLGKTSLRARQVSQRSGELWCELRDDRVIIAGHAVLVIKGAFYL